jgi:hypothetical protein
MNSLGDLVAYALCCLALAVCYYLMAKRRPIKFQIYRRSAPIYLDVGTVGSVALLPLFERDYLLEAVNWKPNHLEAHFRPYGPVEFIEVPPNA